MFHQVFICDQTQKPVSSPKNDRLEEAESLIPEDVKAEVFYRIPEDVKAEDETFNEEMNVVQQHEDWGKSVIKDLVVVKKNEAYSEHIKEEEGASMTCLSYEDTKSFQENNHTEENEEDTKPMDLNNCAGYFKEKSQNSKEMNGLGLCTENPQSTVLSNKDETLTNTLDFVGHTDNGEMSSSIKSKIISGSSFRVLVQDDSITEYITSDSIYPSLTSSTSVKTESKIVCPQPKKITKTVSHEKVEVANEIKSRVRKRKYPRDVTNPEEETSLDSLCNEGIAYSPLRDTDDSCSDWEQEYLASKDVRSKSKTSGQAETDQNKSKKYPRLDSSQVINESYKNSQQILPNRNTNIFSNSIIKQLGGKDPQKQVLLAIPNSPGHPVLQLSGVVQMPKTINESTTPKFVLDIDTCSRVSDNTSASIPKVANVTFSQDKQQIDKISPKTSLLINRNGREKQTTEISSNQLQQKHLMVPSESRHKELQIKGLLKANLLPFETTMPLEEPNGVGTKQLDQSRRSACNVPGAVLSGTRDQSRNVFPSVNSMGTSNNVVYIQSGSDLIRLNETNLSSHCKISNLVLTGTKTSREQSSTLSNLSPNAEKVNRSISSNKDTLYDNIILKSISSAHENLCSDLAKTSEGAECKTPNSNEDGQRCYSNTEHLNRIIIEAQLKPLRIVLHDCMKTSTDSMAVKQFGNMDDQSRLKSLRKRPRTADFKYGDDGDSSSNVSDGDDRCSDWELDCLDSNDTNSGFTLLKKASLEKKDSCLTSGTLLFNILSSNQVNNKPNTDHKSVDPSNSTKQSFEKPDSQNLCTTFTPDSFICSDCGKLYVSKKSFTQHKQDLLCVKQNDHTTQKRGCPIAKSTEIPKKTKPVAENCSSVINIFKSDEKMCNQPSKTHTMSEIIFSNIKTKTLLPNVYEKNPETGLYVVSENNLGSSILSELLNKNISNVKPLSNHNQKPNEDQYDRHSLPQKLFICSFCQKIFKSSSSFDNHFRKLCSGKTRELEHQCDVCGQLFVSKASFTKHKQDLLCVKQNEIIAQKSVCEIANATGIPKKNESFTQLSNCSSISTRVKSDDRICNQANKTHLTSETSFCNIKSKALLPNILERDPEKGVYVAVQTDSDNSLFSQLLNKQKSGINLSSNQKIIKSQNDFQDWSHNVFVCSVCQKVFLSSSSYSNHLNTLCFGKTRKLEHQCDICGKLFKRPDKLENHRNTHTNAKPFKCTYKDCDRCFNSVGARYSHIKEGHKKIFKEKYLCCFCGMTTPSIAHLKAHEDTHRLPEGSSVPTPFKCLQCGKGFISNFQLKSHRREHFPYKCKQCKHKYSSSEALEKHKKSHKSNEEFKCDICSKTFTKKQNLHMHRRNVHLRTMQFFCDICDKGFKQKHHIEQHMISHSDERPITCPECDETFKRKTHLKQHLASFHNKGIKKRQP